MTRMATDSSLWSATGHSADMTRADFLRAEPDQSLESEPGSSGLVAKS